MRFLCPHCSKKGIYFISKISSSPLNPATCEYCSEGSYISAKRQRNRLGLSLLSLVSASIFVYLTIRFSEIKYLIAMLLTVWGISIYKLGSAELLPIDKQVLEKMRRESKLVQIVFSLLVLLLIIGLFWIQLQR